MPMGVFDLTDNSGHAMTMLRNVESVYVKSMTVEDEKNLRDIVCGLATRVQKAMESKQYDFAAESLGQMDSLACIDNPVVERLLADAKHQVGRSVPFEFCRQCRDADCVFIHRRRDVDVRTCLGWHLR